jgi:outer membrane protein OmpA-like peptidoglycan-associated protein
MNTIHIPGLKGSVAVHVTALYLGKDGASKVEFGNAFDATMNLPEAEQTAELMVRATMQFPLQVGRNGVSSPLYTQSVIAIFPGIVQKDGVPLFSVTEKALQGEPTDPIAQRMSQFRFLGGMAWLTATQNKKYLAVKVKLVVGSSDVEVESFGRTDEPVSVTEGVAGKGGGGVSLPPPFDKIVEFNAEVEFKSEVTHARSVNNTGISRTIGDFSQTREWTLLLELPELKQKPKTPMIKEKYLHVVYFGTNKKEINGYPHPRTKSDQIKALQMFVDDKISRYGSDHILGIEVKGFASRLGDTEANIGVSEGRARYVANLLQRLYKLKIDEKNITFRGEPVTEGNDRDNSWEDRAAWVTINTERQ